VRLIKSPAVVFVFFGATSLVWSASLDRLVAPLKDQHAIDGCAWSASAPTVGPGFVFLGEIDDSRSLMNIGGSDVDLALTSEHGSLKKVGDVLERTFKADGMLVKAKYRVTWTCPKGDNSCEVTRFTVSFNVSKRSKQQTVRATGDVGC
jgi:hypothetical protein